MGQIMCSNIVIIQHDVCAKEDGRLFLYLDGLILKLNHIHIYMLKIAFILSAGSCPSQNRPTQYIAFSLTINSACQLDVLSANKPPS